MSFQSIDRRRESGAIEVVVNLRDESADRNGVYSVVTAWQCEVNTACPEGRTWRSETLEESRDEVVNFGKDEGFDPRLPVIVTHRACAALGGMPDSCTEEVKETVPAVSGAGIPTAFKGPKRAG